ncbi:MAG TPA: uracil-DNA glycosylase family protein [Actinomycetota bacterium]
MAEFDPGYAREPFVTLCRDAPGADVYPAADFRVEWGPIFHRGRLDGSARVLVIGQDPGPHESIARRILVGEAGQRVQGFLAKLGVDRSYVMINAFLYSVYGQSGGERHMNDPAIAGYRNRWIDALMARHWIEAVVAFGHLADAAFTSWRKTDTGMKFSKAYEHVPHPTYPESSGGGSAAMAAMLSAWNDALTRLSAAIKHPDEARPLVHYGTSLAPSDDVPIPADDLPAGLPTWMGGLTTWAGREGTSTDLKRATVVVTIPAGDRVWRTQ